MKIKKYLVRTLLFFTVLALVLRFWARLFASQTIVKQNSDKTSYDAIDAYIEEQMRRLHIPGASLAVVEGERIVHLRNLGHARPGGEAPTQKTPFFIGSLTKSITALAVMQLVESGKIKLEAPIQRYLPWFRVADPQASAQITVRHLLNQTSGFPLLQGTLLLADVDNSPDAAKRQAMKLSTFKPTRPVGTKCEYSNLNYNLLGAIIEAASGESYADYIHNHIFIPLGMSNSYTSRAAAIKNGLAMGYRHWFSLPFPAHNLRIPQGSLSSGQLISSADDMAHYLIAHLNGGRYGDVQILSHAGIDEMHRGVKELKMGDISGGLYGMGWFEIDFGPTKTYSHSGNVPDFSAFMAIVPDQKKGVVLLLNADPYGLPLITEEIGMGITALLVGQPPAPIRLNYIQWIMRSLPVILLLQLVGIYAILRSLRRRWENPKSYPGRGRTWWQYILLIPNLTLAVIPLYLRTSGLLRYLHLYNPDVAWIAQISGGLAGIWVFLRTGLILRTQRKAPERTI